MFRGTNLMWSEFIRAGVVSLLAVSVWSGTEVFGGDVDLAQRAPTAITKEFKPIRGGALIEEAIRSLDIDRELIPAIKEEVRKEGRVVLEDVPLPDGGSIALELYERTVFPAGARLVMEFGDRVKRRASRPLQLPKDALVMSGQIQGDEDSFAVLALWDGGAMGLFQGTHGTSMISSGKFGDLKEPVVYDMQRAGGGVFAEATWVCGTDAAELGIDPPLADGGRTNRDQGGLAGEEEECEVIELGIEYDYDMFRDAFNSDASATILYTMILVLSLDEVMGRDLGLHVRCTFVKIRDTAKDPWDAETRSTQLEQLIEHYSETDYDSENPDYAPDIYGLLTSRDLDGGKAEGIGILCGDDVAHFVTGNLNGAFAYPLQDGSSDNWDIFVMTHEIGHILGGVHTHQYCPPLDMCAEEKYFGECQDERVCVTGTIMSYCHTCVDGWANIRLRYHEDVKADIREYLDGLTCLDTATEVTPGVDDTARTMQGTPVSIDVLANDRSDCGAPFIRGLQLFSVEGGSIERSIGTGPFSRDELLYTPPPGLPEGNHALDSFEYYSEGAFGTTSWATVTVKVWNQRLEYLLLDSVRDTVERFDAVTNQHINPIIESNNLLVDPSALAKLEDGRLLVTDFGIDKVLAFDMATGEFLDTFHSSQFIEHPIDMVSTSSHVYVGSRDKQSVAVLTTAGELVSIFQSGGHVQDLLLDEESGQLVVLRDSGNFSGGYEIWDIANEQMLSMQPTPELEAVSCIARHPYGDFMVGDPVTGSIVRYNAEGQGFAGWFLHWQVARFYGIGKPIRVEIGPDELVYIASTTGVHRLTLEGAYVDEVLLADNEPFEAPAAFLFVEATRIPADLDGDGKVDGVDLAWLLGNWSGSGIGDINGDGTVDGVDLAIVLGSWSPS